MARRTASPSAARLNLTHPFQANHLGAAAIAEMARSLKAERWATLARQAEASLVAAGGAGCSQCMRHSASLLESAEQRDAARGLSSLVYLAQALDQRRSPVGQRARAA